PEIDGRVAHPIHVKVREQRLRDESQALCAAGESANHGQRGNRDVHPTVVNGSPRRLSALHGIGDDGQVAILPRADGSSTSTVYYARGVPLLVRLLILACMAATALAE